MMSDIEWWIEPERSSVMKHTGDEMMNKTCIAKCDDGYITYVIEDTLGKKTTEKRKCSFCTQADD